MSSPNPYNPYAPQAQSPYASHPQHGPQQPAPQQPGPQQPGPQQSGPQQPGPQQPGPQQPAPQQHAPQQHAPQQHAPYPPYAPPAPHGALPFGPAPALYRQNVFVPPGVTSGPLVTPLVRSLKLASGIVQVVSLIAGIVSLFVGMALERSGDGVGGAVVMVALCMFGLWYFALLGYGILNMIWTYRFWSWIPADQRYTSMWKKYVSPGQALGFMFIPYFNIYWMFVVYLGIAEILERMRVAYPTDKPPAKSMALLMLIVPLFFFPAGPFLHWYFDRHVEGMAADMQARMASAGMQMQG